MRIAILAAHTAACSLMISLAGCAAVGGETPVANPSKLAGYIGTWVAPCYMHEKLSMTITDAGVKDTIFIARKSEFFAQFGCTGAVLGTRTESAPSTASYAGSLDSAIAFPPSLTPTPAKVDMMGVFEPARRASVTGAAVIYRINAGQPQWCVDFGDRSGFCAPDPGEMPSKSGVQGAFSLNGNTMYMLSSSGGDTLSVGRSFTKE
jgi:hypothetical protein